MNRWAVRHTERLERDLQDGEELLAANRVMLVAASSIASWAAGAPGAGPAGGTNPVSTRRFAPHQLKLSVAKQLGFPLPGWIFTIGVSSRRLLFWRTTPLLAHPEELTASLELDTIAAVRAPRRVGATRLSVVQGDGGMMVVQALWSFDLANVAREFDRVRADGSGH